MIVYHCNLENPGSGHGGRKTATTCEAESQFREFEGQRWRRYPPGMMGKGGIPQINSKSTGSVAIVYEYLMGKRSGNTLLGVV